MKSVRLVEDRRLVAEAIDWLQITIGVALVVGLALATPAVCAWASWGW